MNDSSLKTMLHDYVQGKLSGEEAELVKKMLSNNPQIQKDLEEIKEYYNTLGLLTPITAPDDFLKKVHNKIELKESFFKKVFSKRWISAELAGLAVSVILIIMVVNPFKMDQAPTITYDEVKTPDINKYSVSKSSSKEPTVDSIEVMPKAKKKTVSKALSKIKSRPAPKILKPKMATTVEVEETAAPTLAIKQEEALAYDQEEMVLEKREMESIVTSQAQPVVKEDAFEDVETEKHLDFDAGSVSNEDDKKNIREKKTKKAKSKRRKKSQKIGDYLAPREEKVREIQEKLKELEVAKQEVEKATANMSKGPSASSSKGSVASVEMKMMESSVRERLKELNGDDSYNYDTVEKVEDTESLLKDDLSWMIRKNLNTYENTVLMMDKSEKIFLITMDNKDYKSFEKWLKTKFNDQYTIKDSSIKKEKISFRLEF